MKRLNKIKHTHSKRSLQMLADGGNRDNDVKFGTGDPEKRSHLIWEKLGNGSQGKQNLNKVL